PGAASAGFTECLNAYNGGHAAMWYDATVGASNLTGAVAQNSGYAFAPVQQTKYSGWLWAWSLGMPATSNKKDAAWTFMSWATSKDYIKLVGTTLGWNQDDRGRRGSRIGRPADVRLRHLSSPVEVLLLVVLGHVGGELLRALQRLVDGGGAGDGGRDLLGHLRAELLELGDVDVLNAGVRHGVDR